MERTDERMTLEAHEGLILTPTNAPEVGDTPMRGASGGWTTFRAGPFGSILIYTIVPNDPNDDFTSANWSAALVDDFPDPEEYFPGQIIVIGGSVDAAYICTMSSAGIPAWKVLARGTLNANSVGSDIRTVGTNIIGATH